MKKNIKCPECGKATEYCPTNKYRPFCSRRCRLIDLGEWIEGKYRLDPDEHFHTTGSRPQELKARH